jgi:amino acid transporter
MSSMQPSPYQPPPPAHRASAPPGLPRQGVPAFGPGGGAAAAGFGTTALGRSRLGAASLIFFTVSASAPMTVLAGGIVATYAVTGNIGVPLAFPIVAIVLAIFAVGYAAMSRHVVNAGVFYAYISRGLGGMWGTAASFVALISYNAIQIGLYGLFGFVAAGFFSAHTGLNWSWWAWAFIALAVVAILGVLKVDLNARVLAVLLVCEIIAVILFDLAGFAHPAGGAAATAGLNPKNLFTTGLGGVLAFTIAAFVGFESAGDYAEEAKDPKRTVGRALAATVAITGVLYTVSAWALSVGAGPKTVVDATRKEGPGVVFDIVGAHYGSTVADIANVLLMTSVFAALLSFHNTVARYLFAAGRERVLPRVMAITHPRTKAPLIGSIIQTVLAVIIVAIFALNHKDPVTALFTWLSYVSAVGVLLMMLGTAIANLVFLNRLHGNESAWQKTIAPVLATILLAIGTYIVAANASSLLGTEKGSSLNWVLPGIVFVGAIAGIIWGAIIKATNEPVYDGIGKGGPEDELLEGA